MKRLRLVKVVVQPVFVVEDDDDGTLSDLAVQPVEVSSRDWPTYATTGYLDALDQLQALVNEQPPAT